MIRLNLTRCPAPTHTPGGALRCLQSRPCGQHPGSRWDVLLLPLAAVWAIRPWWPNRLGRAQDAGRAHTPNVSPCKACVRLTRAGISERQAAIMHYAATPGEASW